LSDKTKSKIGCTQIFDVILFHATLQVGPSTLTGSRSVHHGPSCSISKIADPTKKAFPVTDHHDSSQAYCTWA